METESKTEVNGGLECPDVDWDSKAERTTALSALCTDLELSNDSLTEPERPEDVGDVFDEKSPPLIYESVHDAPPQTNNDAPGAKVTCPETYKQENSNELPTLIEEITPSKDAPNSVMCAEETALSEVVNCEKIPVPNESIVLPQTTEEAASAEVIRPEISIEEIPNNDQQTPTEFASSTKDPQDPDTRSEVTSASEVDAIEQMADMSESSAMLLTTKEVACTNAIHSETSQEVKFNLQQILNEEGASLKNTQGLKMCSKESALSVVGNTEKITVTNESVVPPKSATEAAGTDAIPPEIIEDISNDKHTHIEFGLSTKDPEDPETRPEVTAQSGLDAIEQVHDVSESSAVLQTTKDVACSSAIHTETSQEVMFDEQQTLNEEAALSKNSQDPEMCSKESTLSVLVNTEKIPVMNESVAPRKTTEEAAGTEVIRPEISIEEISNNDQQTPIEFASSTKDPQDPGTRSEVTSASEVDAIEQMADMSESSAMLLTAKEVACTNAIHPETSQEVMFNEQQTPNEEAASSKNSPDPEMCSKEPAVSVVGNTEKIPVMTGSIAPPKTSEEAAGAICPEMSIEDISNDEQTPIEFALSTKDPQDPETRTGVTAHSGLDAIEQVHDVSESSAVLQATEEVACSNAVHPETSQEVMFDEEQTLSEEAASSKNSQEPEMYSKVSTLSVADHTEKMPVSNESVVPSQTSEKAAGAKVIHPEISNEEISIDQQKSNELGTSLKHLQDPETEVPAKSVVDTIKPIPVMSEYISSQTTSEFDCAEAIHPETSNEVVLNKQHTPDEIAALPADSQDPVMYAEESSESEVDVIGQMLASSESEDDSQDPVDDVPTCVNYQNDTSKPEEESEHAATSQATNQFCPTGTVSLCAGGGLTDATHNTDAVAVDPKPCSPNKTGSILCTRGTTDNPTEEPYLDDIQSISKEHPGGNQSSTGFLGIDKKTRRVRFCDQEPTPASRISSDLADSSPEIAKLSIKELIKYYKWCNQGISSKEALAKSKQRGLMPPSDNTPHPNCKLKWGEIKNISRVIKEEFQRTKYLVEVYFAGKDPEKELQLVLSKMNVDRHPDCQHSWKELEDFSSASQEYLRLNYKVETFYEGKNAPKVDLDDPPECGILSNDNLQPRSSTNQNCLGSSGIKKESLEISGLKLNELKKYSQWLHVGFGSEEALKRAKEPGLEPPLELHDVESENPDNRQLTYRQRRDIAKIIPGDYAKLRFDIDVVYGGMDPIKQLKLMMAMSKIYRHPNCKHTWEELEEMSNKITDEFWRTIFMVQTFCNGKVPQEWMEIIQAQIRASEVCRNMHNNEYLIDNLKPNSVLPDEKPGAQLKCSILGASSNEATAKIGDPALIPESHPGCKLTMEEIMEISSLIPANLAKTRFKIETYLFGKDPIKLLKIMLDVSNVERHPNCKHTWQKLENMSSNVTSVLERSKFLVDVYCNGKELEELKKKSLLNSKTDVVTVQTRSPASENPDIPNSETMEIAKLSLNQLKKYYKWRILGVSQSQALVKAKEPGLIPQTNNPHPECKLPWEEIKEIAHLIPASRQRIKFQVEVFLGGKDPEEQLKLMMTEFKAKRHHECKHSWEELKQLCPKFPKESWKLKFVVNAFYGGKQPADLLKDMLSKANLSEEPQNTLAINDSDAVSEKSAGPDDTTFEEGPTKELPNWQLKNYYLWRNQGADHSTALAKVSKTPLGEHSRHPNCLSSENEVKQMSVPLVDTIQANRFYIHVYYGGKNPVNTLKYFQSASAVSDSIDTTIEGGLIKDLLNWELKNYYLWRNSGKDHAFALANKSKPVKVTGQHPPHPNCHHSDSEVKKMAFPLSANTVMVNRFFIHVYYGGKDPASTLKSLLSHPVVSYADKDPTESPTVIEPEDISNLSNGPLQFYYNWRTTGCNHSVALSKVKKKLPFSGKLLPHRHCKISTKEINQMSHPLSNNPLKKRRFFIHVYYGGKDPECTLRHFMPSPKSQPEDILSRHENQMSENELGSSRDEGLANAKKRPISAQPLPFQPVAKRTRTCPDGQIIPLDSPEHPINILNSSELRKFHLIFHKEGKSRLEAIIRARDPGVTVPTPKKFISRCLVNMPELKTMSNRLPAKLRQFFLTETFFGGSDPEEVIEYLLRRASDKTSQPDTQTGDGPRKSSGCLDDVLLPLNSPKHPINMILSCSKLTKFYQWFYKVFSHEEAMLKVKSGEAPPPTMTWVSRCLVPKPSLEAISQNLPAHLRKRFMVETFFGGSDPNEVMDYLLRKGDPSIENREPVIVPLDSPEHPINTLNLTELTIYYRWIRKGCSREHAIAKVKCPHLLVPTSKNFVSKCRLSMEELKTMSKGLPCKLQHIFVSECECSGSDPKEVFEYLLAKAKRTERKKCPGEPQTNLTHNAGVPVCTQTPDAGMSSRPNYTNCNAAGILPINLQPPTTHPQDRHISYQQDASNYGHFGSTAVAPFPVAHPNPCNPQPTQNFDPGHPPPGWPHAGHPPVDHPPSGPPISYGYPLETRAPQPFQPPASGSHHADLPQVPTVFPPVVYPPDQSPFIRQPPILYPPPHPIPSPAVPGPSVTPVTPNVIIRSPQVHQSAVTSPGTKVATPQKFAKSNMFDEYEPANKELSKAMLPIKINLKSTSNDVNKSEKQPLQSPPKPKTAILEKKNPIQGDGSVPMHIVPTGYPHERLTEEQMDAIENNLLEAILEMDDDGLKPSFKDSSRSDGRYNITCIDEFSVNWLYKYLNTYQPWPGASLKLISGGPKKIKANAILPPCKADDDQKILKFIERQNKGLNVNLWTIVQRWNNGDFNTCIELVIDEESAEVLQNCSRINFKLGSAEIVIAKDDDQVQPHVGTSAVAESSNTTSISSRKYRRASPPPPPKRMLSGESIPTPPLKRSCNQDKSGSSHNSVERSNSACRAPSRDRFGQSTSKSPSPAERNPWMDWFHAKEEHSNVSLGGTHEIKRGRNYRHSGSRLSEDQGSDSPSPSRNYRHCGSRLSEDRGSGSPSPSRALSKYRKRHVSRSPSQEYQSMSRSPTPDRSRRKKHCRHNRSHSKSPARKHRRSSPGPSSRYYKY